MHTAAIPAPPTTLLAMEFVRGAFEFATGWMCQGMLARECERGDGGAVIVFPGLGTSDASTTMLRSFLSDIGYNVQGWGRGMNTGPVGGFDAFLSGLRDELEVVYLRTGRPVRLIGWSLGGIYARELAKLAPHMVKQVVTLGTPFTGAAESTHGAALFELLSQSDCHKDPRIQARLSITPKVPTVSMYSKSDGVVAWQCAQNPAMAHTENVEMSGVSHLGLVFSPQVYRVLAQQLAKQSGVVIQLDFPRRALSRAA